MAKSSDLSAFVRDALVEGHDRAAIAEALGQAGWTREEIDGALTAWADTPFRPPVPQPRALVSARDFFFYVLLFGTMLCSATYLVLLCHHLIDMFLGSAEGGPVYGDPHARIRWALAVLIVVCPVFIWLSLRDQRALAQSPARRRSAIRKWLTYVALLIAAVVLLGDLASTVYRLLSGDLTLQFLAKAAVVAIVAGAAFLFYSQDVRRGDAA